MHELKAKISARYGTVHRFCQATGLPRSTVYQVLAGTYAGDVEGHKRRIQLALDGDSTSGMLERVAGAIGREACRRCHAGPRRCDVCQELFESQARAVLELGVWS